MENAFKSRSLRETSPYLLRPRRSLREAEADTSGQGGDLRHDELHDAERLDNRAFTGHR